jgi:uncharacterized protein (DUF983 family)
MLNYIEVMPFSILPGNLPPTGSERDRLRRQNNPNNEPVGDFSGRCASCGSSNLWDDNLAYGCNACGALLGTN